MKILQLTDSYPPAIGGMERHVQTLSHELVRRGHQVTVLTIGEVESYLDHGVRVVRVAGWQRSLRRFGADLSHEFHPPAPDPVVVAALRALVRDDRPDVVHGCRWIFYSYVAAKRSGWPPLVLTLHDYGLQCIKKTNVFEDSACTGPAVGKCVGCASGQYGPLIASMLVSGRVSCRPLLGRVDQFIAISTSVAVAAHSSLPAGAAIEVVPSFINRRLLDAGDQRPTIAPLIDTESYLMFVGTLGRHKGCDVLLAAHRRMRRRVPLLAVVAGPGEAPRSGEDVVVVRDAEHAQVMAAWRRAAVAVVPSRWAEPFGQVAVEAMAAGRPVVASDTGGLADVVLAGVTGLLVPAGDADALALALDDLVADPGKGQAMGAAGRVRAGEFTADAVVPRIEQIYRAMLSRAEVSRSE